MKKPSIPDGTPVWLRTTLEILTGRRKNAIAAPPPRTLTFSSPPTQAECEALYAYVNDVRNVLDRLLSRFDS
jgi:hypothetical protein